MNFLDVEQNTDAWFGPRLGKATASYFGCFMANDGKAFGEPAKRYALQLALERMTGKRAEFSFSNEHMERGHEQEGDARDLYAFMWRTAGSLIAVNTAVRRTDWSATTGFSRSSPSSLRRTSPRCSATISTRPTVGN